MKFQRYFYGLLAREASLENWGTLCVCFFFVSLHTHSVGETICEEGTGSSVKILLSKSLRIGYSLQRIPLPPRNGTSHGWTLGSEVKKKTSPTVGTSHGGLRDFGSELTKNTPLPTWIGTSHGGIRNFGSEFTKTPPPPPRIGTSHGGLGDFGSELTKNTSLCRPADTVSLNY